MENDFPRVENILVTQFNSHPASLWGFIYSDSEACRVYDVVTGAIASFVDKSFSSILVKM